MRHTRRQFIRTAAYTGAAVSSLNILQAQGSGGTIKAGLIGCGGRGTGALKNFIEAAKHLGYGVEVVAVADAFQDRVDKALQQFQLEAKHGHAGFTAYQKVAASNAEFVVMATPPNFRPVHLGACVEAGKHCFIEKPVAVDPPGVRRVIEIGEAAKAKGLTLVAGTQRRYSGKYQDARSMIENGAVGTILGGALYWNMGTLWKFERKDMSAADYMARNWLNFTEMSGDHIVEQHVHQLDVACWYLGRPPQTFLGYGGRARRDSGNQFDFFSVDMDWGDGVHIHSQCRQIAGCYDRVGEFFRGSEGTIEGTKVSGKEVKFQKSEATLPEMIQEHVELIQSAREKRGYLNAARPVAEATLCAIGGRISAYTGKLVRWGDLIERQESEFYNLTCSPAALDFEKGEVQLPEERPAVPGEAKGFKSLN